MIASNDARPGLVNFTAGALRLPRSWTLDTRSIAIGRIGLGIAGILATLARFRDLDALLTDQGVLPRAYSLAHFNYSTAFKVYFLSGSHTYVATLLTVHLVCAVMLTLGVYPRLAAVGCFLLTLGERERNLLTIDGCDDLVLGCMVWCAFLPTAARASWHSLRSRDRNAPETTEVSTVAVLGIALQMSLIYFTSTFHKSGPTWRITGEAVYEALSLDYLVLPPGLWLREHRTLCSALTLLTLAWEFGGPLLLWVPLKNFRLRLFTLLGFVAMHLGFALCLNVGFFSATAISAWLMFIPPTVWDAVGWPTTPTWLQSLLDKVPGAASSPSLRLSSAGTALGAIAAVLLLLGNLHAIGLPVPRPFEQTLQALAFDQYWEMFSPNPPTTHGWMVFPAKTASGAEVDIFRQAPVDYGRPVLGWGFQANRRWGNLLRYMQHPDTKPLYPDLFRYLCERWNGAHGPEDRVTSVQSVFMHVETTPSESEPPPVKEVLAEGTCPVPVS